MGVATSRPAGRLSVNATPVSAMVALELVTVKLSDVEPASPMDAAPKTFEIVGGVATVKFAAAVFPAPPLVLVTVLDVFV